VTFLPELPKTGTGKIDRQALLSGSFATSAVDASPNRRPMKPRAETRQRRLRRGGAA